MKDVWIGQCSECQNSVVVISDFPVDIRCGTSDHGFIPMTLFGVLPDSYEEWTKHYEENACRYVED